jgi:diguanylate cyclase
MYALIITYLAFQTKKYYLKVEKLSKYDSLTGLYNKGTFEILLEKALKQLEREGKHLFFMIIDIDDFKAINDSHGHLIGDEAIKKVTEKLKNLLRDSDTFARFGGNEFLIYLADYNDEAASKLIDRIEKSFANSSIELNDETILKITLSIGYTKSRENCDYKSLLERADKALYISKETGKGIGIFLA